MKTLNRVAHIGSIFCLLLAVVANNFAQKPDDDAPIKVNTVLLNIPVIASDKDGRNVAGLKIEDFSIVQNGEEQKIEYFADAEGPVSLAIVIDTSQSVASELSRMKKVAREVLLGLNPDDQAMVVSFNHKIDILSGFTSDKKKLNRAINDLYTTEGDGIDNMYDAVFDVVTKDFASVKGRKAVLVLTDGIVGGHKISKSVLTDALSESDVFVYPILYYVGPSRGFTMEKVLKWPKVEILLSMARVTGGRFNVAAAENFDSSLHQISDELRKYYIVGFYPKGDDGFSNSVRVKVNRENVTVRTKGTIRLKAATAELKK